MSMPLKHDDFALEANRFEERGTHSYRRSHLAQLESDAVHLSRLRSAQ